VRDQLVFLKLASLAHPMRFLCPVQNIRLDELRERLRLALLTAEGSGEYVPTPIYML